MRSIRPRALKALTCCAQPVTTASTLSTPNGHLGKTTRTGATREKIWQPMPLMTGHLVNQWLLVLNCSNSTSWSCNWRLKERSEEHTSELQSRGHLVCRLLLEKKKEIEQREYQT